MSRRFHHLVVRRLAAPRLGRNLVQLLAGICLLLGLASTGSAHAQTAAGWNKRGLDAEYRQNYDASYEDYLKAHTKAPKNLTYIAHLERMRGLAAAQHVDHGRALRQNGDYAGALTEFMRALQIDPGDQVAEQEIAITQRDQPPAGVSPLGQAIDNEQMSQQAALLKSLSSLAGPVVLQPVSNDPITLHMVEDTKVIYQAIAKLAGLNVLFDPDYTAKRIPVDLTNVSLSDALRIVGTISGTFYKPVTSNTILIAQNTRTKRTDLDDLAVQTFYLSNSAQANDGNEIQTAIRNLLDPSTKIYYVPSQNALVLRATADQLLLAQKIINDLDRAKPEVVVDVAVLEVNRDKVRNLGITLPQSITITPQASPTTSSSTSTSTTTSTTSSSFTLDNLAHLNSTNFGVGISGGTLNALLTDTDTKVLQNPRIRASDGQRATLKIGSKIPIATGSYSSTLSTTASLGVQTQFTYLDVGVNIDMTPTVHFDREVSLKIKIEVSTESGTETISGVTEPIISQRSIDQVIQLKEGEPSILAGILTRQDNKNTSGTPYLGEIPFFKFFFASTNKEVQRDEIIFVLIPHIVRESVLTAVNTGAIDTGTGQSIELRHDANPTRGILPGNDVGGSVTSAPRAVPAARSAADAANALIQGSAAPAANAAYASVGATPVPSPGGTPPVSFAVQPANSNYAVGSTFQAAVTLTNGRDIFSVPLQVQFDPHVLQLVNVDAGNLLTKGDKPVSAVHRDEGNGLVTIALSRPPNSGGVTGDGGVCTLTFKAIQAGDSGISLVKAGAKDSAQNTLPTIASSAVVHVK